MPDAPTPAQLMARVRFSQEALAEARADMLKFKSPEAASTFCELRIAADQARAGLPKLHLVPPCA